MKKIIVPPGAGVGSAIGFLRAPFSFEETRGAFFRLAQFEPDRINDLLRDMRTSAATFVRRGVGDAGTQTRITAFMRYRGQGWEIPVPIPSQDFSKDDVELFTALFENAYRDLFGRTIEDLEIEIANWSVVVSTPQPEVARVRPQTTSRPVVPSSNRRFFDARSRAFVEGPEIMRTELAPGDFVDGPAVIVEDETCTIVTSAFAATVQADGALLLTHKPDREATT